MFKVNLYHSNSNQITGSTTLDSLHEARSWAFEWFFANKHTHGIIFQYFGDNCEYQALEPFVWDSEKQTLQDEYYARIRARYALYANKS